MVKLDADDVAGPFVYPFPKKPEDQAKLTFLGYRNMLEKVAERYHTTPRHDRRAQRPRQADRRGQVLRLPNVVPASRNYAKVKPDYATMVAHAQRRRRPAQGDHVVVDKSEGVLKVLDAGRRWSPNSR